MSDAMEVLGTLIDESAKRDAIHIAVAPVVAEGTLKPGQNIGFVPGSSERVSGTADHIGIVDPYLKAAVLPGQRFYMFLYPRTITSLRHEWTHPAFEDNKRVSEQWIRELADSVDVTYNQIMDHARQQAAGADFPYLIGGAAMEGESTPEEFWHHFEVVTGEKVAPERRENFFSCSC
jgi:hypothetical protein